MLVKMYIAALSLAAVALGATTHEVVVGANGLVRDQSLCATIPEGYSDSSRFISPGRAELTGRNTIPTTSQRPSGILSSECCFIPPQPILYRRVTHRRHSFTFMPGNHTVTQSTFAAPCVNAGIASGFRTAAENTVRLSPNGAPADNSSPS